MKTEDLTNKRFGKLIALQLTRKNNRTAWICKCDCGNECIVQSCNLKSGTTTSCGCARGNSKNLVGKRFGKLIVIEKTKQRTKDRKVIWRCRCDCGNEVFAPTSRLTSGRVKSCGCYCKEMTSLKNTRDLLGQKFGKLTVIAKTDKRQNRSVVWKCQCDCGNIIEVVSASLVNGNTQSCGCTNFSKGEEKIIEILKNNNILFEQEKTFVNCRFPDTQKFARFDFWVNNEYLIEYDGRQHFIQSSQWEPIEQIVKRDAYKNQWCKENSILLIRIPYTHLNNLCIEDLLIETSRFIV